MELDNKKRLATQIANDSNMLAFLKEMFVPEYSALHKDAEKNILALTDEDYGKIMKLFYITRTENEKVIEEIKRMGAKPNPKGNTKAVN